jgi:cobalamin biosynthesis Mg chelatase CobN
VSHNVPPYARAGLYKELASMRDLLSELRTSAVEQGTQPRKQQDSGGGAPAAAFIPVPGQAAGTPGSETGSSTDVIPLIVAAAEKSGIFDDLPYTGSFADPEDVTAGAEVAAKRKLSSERAAELLKGPDAEAFAREFALYGGQLRTYLSQLEQRLFSEGLHEMGAPLRASQVLGYLDACFGPEETGIHGDALDVIAQGVVAMRDEQSQTQARTRKRSAVVTYSLASTSGLLLRAEAVQRERERERSLYGANSDGTKQGPAAAVSVLGDWQPQWDQNRRIASESGGGVDWSDGFTDEVRPTFFCSHNLAMTHVLHIVVCLFAVCLFVCLFSRTC